MTTAPDITPLTALVSDCEIHLAGDAGYDAARMPWNVAIDQRPAAVAIPRTIHQVQDVVRAAAAAGLKVAPQSTGHAAAALAERPLDDVVLVRLSELTGVLVEPTTGTARILGGTLWRDVIDAATARGLTALHGSSPDVAVVGYVLGGGLSFYGRLHGVAANSIRSVEVVTADGSLIRASATEYQELFWAVRGGGGNFGVVVAIELELLPYPDVVAGMLLWDRERAPEVVRRWVEWSRTAPESVTTSLRVMSFPPIPELPPFLSGRDIVVIDGAVVETDERTAEVLEPLRALAPELDTFGRIPSAALLDVHMDPPGPSPVVGDHCVLGELDDAAVEAFLAQVGPGTGSGLIFAELRQLSGAFARPSAGGGVLSSVDGEYALMCVATAPTPQAVVEGRVAAFSAVRAMSRWSQAGLVPTFTETRVQASRFYGADLAELCRIRDAVDPNRLFVANHPL